jgi:hypothetical protein
MAAWRNPLRRAAVLVALILAVPLVLLKACDMAIDATLGKPEPTAGIDFEAASPDGRWIATSETVDNGLGFGMGMMYYEIHVRRPNERIKTHGDADDTTVFYIHTDGRQPRPTWLDARHLLIEHEVFDDHGKAMEPGRHDARHDDVQIVYRGLPPPIAPAVPTQR